MGATGSRRARVRGARLSFGATVAAVVLLATAAGCATGGGGYYVQLRGFGTETDDLGSPPFNYTFNWNPGGRINETATGYTVIGAFVFDGSGTNVQVNFDVDSTTSPKTITSVYGTTSDPDSFTSTSASVAQAAPGACTGAATTGVVLTMTMVKQGPPQEVRHELVTFCDPQLVTDLI